MPDEKIRITEDDFTRLKRAYKKAVEENAESFVFDFMQARGQTLLTKYAKYLIQYIESQVENGR